MDRYFLDETKLGTIFFRRNEILTISWDRYGTIPARYSDPHHSQSLREVEWTWVEWEWRWSVPGVAWEWGLNGTIPLKLITLRVTCLYQYWFWLPSSSILVHVSSGAYRLNRQQLYNVLWALNLLLNNKPCLLHLPPRSCSSFSTYSEWTLKVIRGNTTSGHFIWNLWNKPTKYGCKILFNIWLF